VRWCCDTSSPVRPRPFELVDNHVVLTFGKVRALLDTGAVHSFGTCPPLDLPWRGLTPIPPTGPFGRTIEQIADASGIELDLLLGCDVMAECRLRIDWRERTLTFGPLPAGCFPTSCSGLPVGDVRIDGRLLTAVIDTGARLSYVRPGCVPCEASGSTRDFNFLSGSREDLDVPLVACQVEYEGFAAFSVLGVAVGSVESALELMRLDAIVGTDLMARAPASLIDLPPRVPSTPG